MHGDLPDPNGDDGGEPDPEGRSRAGRAGNPHAARGTRHLRQGRLEEAVVELRRALEREPARGELRFRLGLALDGLDRIGEAIEEFRRAARLLPGRAEVFLAVGAAAGRLGRHEEALRALDRALALDSGCEPAWARRILALSELGRFEEADTAYFLAQEHLDRVPGCLMAMGESRLARADHARAAWCFREALRLEPDVPRLRARLAAALAGTGDDRAALAAIEEEDRLHPDDPWTLLEHGDLLARLGRPHDAARRYRDAASAAPQRALMHARLGATMLALEGPAAAIEPLERAYRLEPGHPGIRLSLGRARLRVGDRAEAARLAREELAAARDAPAPTTADGRDERGRRMRDAAWLLGEAVADPADRREAVATLESLRATRPDDLTLLGRLAALGCAARLGRRARGWCRRLARAGRPAAAAHNLILDDLASDRLRLAAARLRRALRAHPDDAGLRRLRSAWWLAAAAWPWRAKRRDAKPERHPGA